MDHLILQLQDRLIKPLPRLQAQHLLRSKISKLTPETVSSIKEEYYPLLPSPGLFESELENWKATVTSQALTLVDEPTQALDLAEHLFPNMATIFHILLTMPVTTASSERSFSV